MARWFVVRACGPARLAQQQHPSDAASINEHTETSTTDGTFGPYERRLLAPKTQDSIYLFTAMLRASSGRGSECQVLSCASGSGPLRKVATRLSIPRPRLRRGIALLCGNGGEPIVIGAGLRTADLSATPLSAYSSAKSRVDHLANSCVPPVTEPFPAEDSFLGEQTFGATVRDEHLFQPAPPRDLLQLLTSFAAQRKVIVGTAVVATLTVGALAYVFWPAAGEKKETETAEATQSAAPVQAAPRIPERSLAAPTAV